MKPEVETFLFKPGFRKIYLAILLADIALLMGATTTLSKGFAVLMTLATCALAYFDQAEKLVIDRKVKGEYNFYGVYLNGKFVCNYLAENEETLQTILAIDGIFHDRVKWEGKVNI